MTTTNRPLSKILLALPIFLFISLPVKAQIVCLGASNTKGQGVSPQEAFPAQLEQMLRTKGYTGQVANAGISGDTTRGMLSRLESAVPPGTRVVLLQPGGNDARQGGNAADREANLAEILARLKARQIPVIMVENSTLSALLRQYHQSDYIHLTPEGYRLLAAQLLPQVAPALGLRVN
jgi:acyl-CoA thioesterase-1